MQTHPATQPKSRDGTSHHYSSQRRHENDHRQTMKKPEPHHCQRQLRFGSSNFLALVAKSLSVLEIFRIRAQNEVRFEFATNTILRMSPKIEPDATPESLAASFSVPAIDRQSHIPSGHCFVIAVSSLSQWRSQFDHIGIISSRKRMIPRREPSRPHPPSD
jgi:hypothetical protein